MAVCCIKGCEKKVMGSGMCSAHYTKLRKYGNPIAEKQAQFHGLPLMERLMKRVEKGETCWVWTGSKNQTGYGMINVEGTPRLVHRIVWRELFGVITPEQFVCHRCDNPSCVNPAHLFLGDYQINSDDKISKGRHRWGLLRGEKHGGARLSREIVQAIRASAENGVVLARRYGVSTSHVSDIRRGKVWKHTS